MDGKKILELKQERATLTTGIRAIMEEFNGKEMDGEKKGEMSKMEARFDELNGSILKEEKQLERERVIGEKKDPEARVETDKQKEIRSAFNGYLIEGTSAKFAEYRALAQDNPTQAGYLVAPEQFATELIKDLADSTFMRQKAKTLPPLKGAQSLGFPTRTAGMSSFAWGTEVQAPTADTTLAFGKREFKPNPATSEILISKTLIRNSSIGTDALIRGEIAEEVTSRLETAYMTGTGAGQPLGLFIASNDGIPTTRDISTGNTATEIKFDGLIEAMFAVKAQYRAAAEWILSRTAIKQIMKLKDGAGQYVWQPSVTLGAPNVLLGHAVNESEYVPNTFTAGLYVGLFGNLKNYWICDSLQMEIQVLMELYARTNQVDYITRIETDGAPIMSSAFSRIKLGA